MIRVEIGPTNDPARVFDQGDLLNVGLARVHTAVSDLSITVPFDASVRDTLFEPLRMTLGTDLVFRGEVKAFDWDERDGRVRIRADGIEDRLSNQQVNRQPQNTFTFEVIQDVFDQDTGFDATVQDPAVDNTVADQTVIDATTTADFDAITSIPDDKPIGVSGDALRALPVARWTDGSDYATGNGAGVSDPNGTGGNAIDFDSSIDGGDYTYNWDYLAPNGDTRVAFRYRFPDDIDDDGSFEGPVFELTVNGIEIARFGTESTVDTDVIPPSRSTDGFRWFSADVGGALDGQETVSINVLESTGGRLRVDEVLTFDARYRSGSDLDNTVDGDGNLATPGTYPTETASIDTQSVIFNVTDVAVDADLNGTTDAAITVDTNGTNPQTATGTETASFSFSDPGTEVSVDVTLPTVTTTAVSTPTEANQAGRIDALTVTYDGDDRNVISDGDFRGDALSVLQRLHERAGYRFVVDHDDQTVESFQTGTRTRPASWTAINRAPSEQTDDYRNRVTIRGAKRDDGTRPTATVQDDGEVGEFGVRLFDAVRPDITTVDEALSQARGILARRAQRRVEGTIEVPPQVIQPGYRYTGIDWFRDGDLRAANLERVELSESYQDARTTLTFQQDQDIVGTIVDIGFEVASTKQGL